MKKLDYKKAFKELYLPKGEPTVIDVPPISFAMLEGTGNPNGEAFAENVQALYSFSYAVRMSYKSSEVPLSYYEYTVFPLEGVWDLMDKTKSSKDKDNYVYTLMIRQPDFLTDALFKRFVLEAKKKKPNPSLENLFFSTEREGKCCQMLHYGSFDDEPESFALMEQFCLEQGFVRASKQHREIYLTDPRKTEAHQLKTVLRFKIHPSASIRSQSTGKRPLS